MVNLMLVSMGWAGDVGALTKEFPLVSVVEMSQFLLLEAKGGGVAPEGITAEWPNHRGHAAVVVTNDTAATIEIDWNQSVFLYPSRDSVGIAPGSTSAALARDELPNTILLAGTRVSEILIREDAIDEADRALVRLQDYGEEVRVSLGLMVGGEAVRMDETLTVSLDRDKIRRIQEIRARLNVAQPEYYNLSRYSSIPVLFRGKRERYTALGNEIAALGRELAGLLSE